MNPSIVVPLDGSRFAEIALPWAKALASREAAEITLVSVIEMPTEFAAWITAEQLSQQPEMADVVDERRQYLAAVADQYSLIDPKIAIRFGAPAREILTCAEEARDQPAVVVMSTHGYGGVKRLAFGSVALQIIHKYRGPIMTVRDETPAEAPRLDRLLIPVDGSDFSATAVTETLRLLGDPHPRVHLVRVLGTPTWAARTLDHGLMAEYLEASRDLAQEQLDAQRQKIAAGGYEVTAELRPHGSVVEEIVAAAADSGADIIAMSTHGMGGVGRIVLGSTADGVLRRSPLPVLLLRPETQR